LLIRVQKMLSTYSENISWVTYLFQKTTSLFFSLRVIPGFGNEATEVE